MSEPGSKGNDDSPKRRRRNAAATRTDILQAASRRFARAGVGHVTLKEIAEDVGVTPALVLRYFGSKHALFEAVARDRSVRLELPAPSADRAKVLAHSILDYWQDPDGRAVALTLIRSAGVEGAIPMLGEELRSRITEPWTAAISGEDVELRISLLSGLIMGVGLFSLGLFLDPDAPPLDEHEYDRAVGYLASMLAACLEEA
jgi:AcrR family transcriptional regulator